MKSQFIFVLLVTLFARSAKAAPANDNFANAQIISGSAITVSGSNVGATAEPNEPEHDFETPRASVWYRWTPSQSGYATVTTAGSDFDTIVAIYRGSSLLTLTSVASNDDEGGMTSKVSFVVTAGVIYYIAIDGYSGDSGTIQLDVSLIGGISAPGNDYYAKAIALGDPPVSISASNFLATLETSELTPVTNGGASVWWTWTAPKTAYYLISTGGSDFDTILSIYRAGTLITWNDDTSIETSQVRIYARAGVRYHISVQGYRAAMGRIELAIAEDPPKPAPAWTLQDLDGQFLNSADFTGKVVILDFWATWCGPCIEEIPQFISMQDKYGPDGLVIIGVATDTEGVSVVRPFVESYNVNYISTLVNSQVSQNYGPVEFIPSTYIINRQGMITDKFVGVYPQKAFEDAITPLLYPEIPVQASREGANVVLRWAAASKGYTVQFTSSATAPNWGDLPTTITVSGEFNIARIPISGSARFFRLVHH